jgi:hypothetical protein
MKSYHVDVKHLAFNVLPNMEQINGYFQAMSDKKCQLVVCVMDAKNEDDLTQLKADIKDCGTIRYGE